MSSTLSYTVTAHNAINRDHSMCGLQLCQHPACWNSVRKNIMEARKVSLDSKHSASRDRNMSTQKSSNQSPKELSETDGLPCLSILNLAGDIASRKSTTNASWKSQSETTSFPLHDLTKIQWLPLGRDSLAEMMQAPTNTPQHSAHGFNDTKLWYPHHTDSNVSSVKQGPQPVTPHHSPLSCAKVSMTMPPPSAMRKKVYLWASYQKSRSSSEIQELPLKLRSGLKSKSIASLNTSRLILPTNVNFDQANELKGKKYKKTLQQSRARADTHSVLVSRYIELARQEARLGSSDANGVKQFSAQLFGLKNHDTHQQHYTSETGRFVPSTNIGENILSNNPTPAANQAGLRSTLFSNNKSGHESRGRCSNSPNKSYNYNSRMFDQIKTNEFAQQVQTKDLLASGTGLVSTITGYNAMPSSPPKPFHYSTTPTDLHLCPITTPAPVDTLTERDSQYDDMIGGSTVLVHPSVPGTLSSWGQPMSKGSNSVPKKTEAGTNDDDEVSEPWPQIPTQVTNSSTVEKLDLGNLSTSSKTSASINNNKLPSPRSVITISSSKPSVREDVTKADASPAPPPPSPEVPLRLTPLSKKRHPS